MIEAPNPDARRADEARAKLLLDIRELKKMGNKMIDRTETAIQKAPTLIGLGVLGAALLGVAILASRRRPARRFPAIRPERSFFAEAARNAALSALGILSGRITQHLLLGTTLDEKPQKPL